MPSSSFVIWNPQTSKFVKMCPPFLMNVYPNDLATSAQSVMPLCHVSQTQFFPAILAPFWIWRLYTCAHWQWVRMDTGLYLSCIGCAYSLRNLFKSSLTTVAPLSIASLSSSVGGGSWISNVKSWVKVHRSSKTLDVKWQLSSNTSNNYFMKTTFSSHLTYVWWICNYNAIVKYHVINHKGNWLGTFFR